MQRHFGGPTTQGMTGVFLRRVELRHAVVFMQISVPAGGLEFTFNPHTEACNTHCELAHGQSHRSRDGHHNGYGAPQSTIASDSPRSNAPWRSRQHHTMWPASRIHDAWHISVLCAWQHGACLNNLGHLLGSSGIDATSAWVQMGGMGFLHYNMTAEEQVQQAKRVKQHVPGFVTRPATLAPQSTIADFESLKVPAPIPHALYPVLSPELQ